MNFENIEPHPVVCRQSSIACALHCPRKWWCKYRMGITLRGERVKEGASLGKIYHKFQEFGPGREQEVKAWVQKEQNALMERVNRGEDLDGEIARKANLMTDLYHKAEVMAQIFWEKYPQPSYFKVIGQEIKHTMVWNGLTLSGTIDKLMLNEHGSVWIRDHKSTGRPLKFLFGGMAWSLQARIYRILVEDFISKQAMLRAVKGFILDGILKPGIKLCRTDQKNAKDWNCTPEETYLRRVKEWYEDADEKLRAENKDPYGTIHSKAMFYTEPLFPNDLVHVLKSVMGNLAEIPAEKVDYFLKDITRRACSEYERQCDYHDLCSTDPKQWDSLFETKYKIVKPAEDTQSEEATV